MPSISITPSTQRKWRLLIVDDDEMVRQLYASLLTQQAAGACEILQAAHGTAGLAALRTQNFDCVLLDFSLPDMNGLEFLVDATLDGELPCAVVLVTGKGNEATAVEAMKRGVQDYLVKGQMDMGGLWRVIERAVTQVKLRQQLAESTRNLERRSADLVCLNEVISRSEARFRRLVEATPNAMVMINAVSQIEMVNTRTEHLFGYERSELLGRPGGLLLPESFGTDHARLRRKALGEPQTAMQFGLRRDGRKFEVEISVSTIETEEGPKSLYAIVDISERVRLEAQLRQSQKMEAIGRLTAGVAHDFNNLLQALVGSLEMLLDLTADRPEAVRWGEVALRAASRGSELTQRLLSFSRQQILRASLISVNILFEDLKLLISHLFDTNIRASTNLVVVPCLPDLAVLADRAQLEAALINLAVNARDAMSFGGCLRISAYAAEADPAIVQPGRYTVISVADTGSGMDAGTLAQACEPFFTTKGINGTGLGLSMVQGFARQSGGEAHITSVVGEGTTIDLWLPAASLSSVVQVQTIVPPQTHGCVLVVDDFPDSLVVVTSFLRLAGLHVTTAESGALAIAELESGKRFDAIITDFAMPGMNGAELLREAYEIDSTMAGMIITVFSDPDLCFILKNIAVLVKPFNRAELVETVQSLIVVTQQARQLQLT